MIRLLSFFQPLIRTCLKLISAFGTTASRKNKNQQNYNYFKICTDRPKYQQKTTIKTTKIKTTKTNIRKTTTEIKKNNN